MATLNDIIQETQRLLQPQQRSMPVFLNGNYTAGAASITFTDSSAASVNTMSIVPGVILSMDLELFLVTSAPSGGSVGVSPGYLGSTPANHLSGAICYVSRRFTDFECYRQINNVLDELGGEGLYNLGTIEFVYNAVQQSYDLTDINNGAMTGYIEGVSLRFKTPLPDRKYGTIGAMKWEVLPNMSDDTNYPSGYALILNGGGWPGQNMLFNYKQSFPHFTNTTTPATDYAQSAQTVALLPATANDLPPMGAMIRMVAPREVARNQTVSQPDSRLAPEVPPGAVAASVNAVRATYYMRINEEKSRLKRNVGQMRRRY
jgi:hypothetical protein